MTEGRTAGPWRVFGALIVLTVAEVALVYLGLSKTALVGGLIGTALIKACLVAFYFMHLKFEGFLVWSMILGTCLIGGIFLAALVPDIVIGL